MRRSALALWLAALTPALVGTGCGCREETLAPVVFDDASGDGPIDPSRVLGPPWQPPTISQLDNGALVHWLVEPGSPAFHLRILMPTAQHSERLGAAGTSAAVEALGLRLGARLRRIEDAHFEVRSRAGRIEIAVHGRDGDAAELITVLAETLRDAGDPKLLAVAQGKAVAKHREADASALAAAGLITRLFGHRLAHEYASKQDMAELNRAKLERSWTLLTDPRHCLVVVHSGRSATEFGEAVEVLGTRWKVGVIGSGKPTASQRLHLDKPNPQPATWLLTSTGAAPLAVLSGIPDKRGRAVIMVGRVLPTATIEDRALARMAQRLLQEELDVRLIPGGPVSVLALRVQVGGDPIGDVGRAIERMQEMFAKPQPEPRIRAAADLWLGARMVEASASGEDWTSLWSESIDLASEDREVFAALAREAKAMLELEPEQIRAYQEKWLDPRGGEGGWVWVASGLTAEIRAKLAAKVALVEI